MNINPIPTGRTAKTDAAGVLDTLVKQPYDNQPTEDQGGCHLEESFKGPYSKLKEVLSHRPKVQAGGRAGRPERAV